MRSDRNPKDGDDQNMSKLSFYCNSCLQRQCVNGLIKVVIGCPSGFLCLLPFQDPFSLRGHRKRAKSMGAEAVYSRVMTFKCSKKALEKYL